MADCEFCGSGVDVEAQDMGEGRTMLLCASCRANIAAGEERDARKQVNPAMGLEFVNTARWEPLGYAYAMSLRLTELHLAICMVEECGASPELTKAVTRLSARLQYLQSKVRKSVNASIGNGWTEK